MPEEEVLKEELEDVTQVEDETEKDVSESKIVYNITSYGSDPEVEGLVQKLRKGDIVIPAFQRAFVWKEEDASSFIESLILGLPVPGIFLATEQKTNRMLVIDGQQRLKSLLFFYEGYFDPKKEEKKQKVFKLVNVQPQLEGKTYQTLEEKDKRRLDNSIIHATIIKQESPKDGDTSIYHIFHRLNAGGMILKPQEIRRAAFHGAFLDVISALNDYHNWRKIFGKKNRRLKDEELILRFFALYFDIDSYQKPMEEYLNTFCSKKSKAESQFFKECELLFTSSIDVFFDAVGDRAFKPKRVINAAVFDSMMVGLASRLAKSSLTDIDGFRNAYIGLIDNPEYQKYTTDGTSDVATVASRINMTKAAFSSIK
ncbi:MAG: DUF262 domain-containing protein [Bacteroidetes bacterium]|nr:DUF262 domain-containing protein [Bacteroidota bacterium]